MGSPLTADKVGMELCNTWRCPGCGALVVLPSARPAPTDIQGERNLDRLAQASCGCWVGAMSDRGMARLLEAIVRVDERFSRPSERIAGRRA